jgi:hypothetical protein
MLVYILNSFPGGWSGFLKSPGSSRARARRVNIWWPGDNHEDSLYHATRPQSSARRISIYRIFKSRNPTLYLDLANPQPRRLLLHARHSTTRNLPNLTFRYLNLHPLACGLDLPITKGGNVRCGRIGRE